MCLKYKYAFLNSFFKYYPTYVRALGVGASNGMGRAGAIATYFIGKILLDIDDRLAVSIYACIGLLSTFVSLFLKETKGRILQ